jgi:hypothetical protein
MTDAKDHNGIAVNPISNDIGISAHQFTHGGSGNGAPPVRKIYETIALIAQS